MKYIEFCAGIGGTRSGLDAAGWDCVLAVDHDPDAVHVHQVTHGEVIAEDIACLSAEELPHAEVWVAGFPCQPFSSSGSRVGFHHKSGNVFEHLTQLIEKRRPSLIVLENVVGLLTNKAGHTFATVLSSLTKLGYEVDWMVMDLRWFKVPQSRPRLFVIAALPGTLIVDQLQESQNMLPAMGETVPSVFCNYLKSNRFSWSLRSSGRLSNVIEITQPKIGKARYKGPHFFAGLGHSSGEEYISFNILAPKHAPKPGSMAAIVAPEFAFPGKIRSARYWSMKGGGGAAGLHIRDEALSHCIGTSLGGAPLFAVPITTLKNNKDREAFLRFSNWHREQDNMLIMRLSPERSVLLFGPHTAGLSKALGSWNAGATRKFKLVGNMVAPVCAKEIATMIMKHSDRSAQKNTYSPTKASTAQKANLKLEGKHL